MEKQYTQEKNEKLNARKEDVKSMPAQKVREEKKAKVSEGLGKEISSAEIDALAGVAPKTVPGELTKEAVAEGFKGEKREEKKEEEKETKKEEKKDEKKEKGKPKIKKEKAIVNGLNLGISKKHSMAICNFIRGKNPEDMIPILERVVKLKVAIPMKGEIPHRKGKMMSGRYPVNASKVFIGLLKTLNGNCSVNGIDNPVITLAVPNDASRPFKRGGSMRFKRTNVYLEAREKVEKVKVEKGK